MLKPCPFTLCANGLLQNNCRPYSQKPGKTSIHNDQISQRNQLIESPWSVDSLVGMKSICVYLLHPVRVRLLRELLKSWIVQNRGSFRSLLAVSHLPLLLWLTSASTYLAGKPVISSLSSYIIALKLHFDVGLNLFSCCIFLELFSNCFAFQAICAKCWCHQIFNVPRNHHTTVYTSQVFWVCLLLVRDMINIHIAAKYGVDLKILWTWLRTDCITCWTKDKVDFY